MSKDALLILKQLSYAATTNLLIYTMTILDSVEEREKNALSCKLGITQDNGAISICSRYKTSYLKLSSYSNNHLMLWKFFLNLYDDNFGFYGRKKEKSIVLQV